MKGALISSAVIIEGYEPELPDYLKKPLRRSDEFIRLSVSALHQALTRVSDNLQNDEKTGLFLGTCFGPMQCNFDVLEALVEGDPVSPTLFSHSVFNAAAGYVSRLFAIFGGAWTITSFGWPFLACLENALMFLNSGRLDRAVVIHVESYSPLLLDAGQRMIGAGLTPWNPGAAAWVLDRSSGTGRGCFLAKVQLNEQPVEALCYLERNERVASLPDITLPPDPLAVSKFLTRLCNAPEKADNEPIRISACFGHAEVIFQTGEND